MKNKNIARTAALITTIAGALVNLGFFMRSWGNINIAGVGFALWVLSPWLVLTVTLRQSWNIPSRSTAVTLLSTITLLLSSQQYYQTLIANYDAQAELIFIILPGMALPLPLLLVIGFWITDHYAKKDSESV